MTTNLLKRIHQRATRRLLRDCDTCHATAGQPCRHNCPEGQHWGYPRGTST
jgi:hypothetical protein